MVAEELEFDGILANSLDGSSDRDFVLEFAFCLASIATHLSGWAEEWILWSTTEFGFLRLPQEFCTGSSIMPQKINPDVLELIRGKTGRVVGNLMACSTILKGLPLAYNRDLQEDKERLFDSVDTVAACLDLAAPIVAGAELNRDAIAARLDEGYLDATTLMEHLIMKGVPQRTAHEIIGRLVATAMKRGVPLADLPLDAFQSAHESLDASVYEVLGAERAVEAIHQLRFDQSGTSRTSAGHLARTALGKQLEAPSPRTATYDVQTQIHLDLPGDCAAARLRRHDARAAVPKTMPRNRPPPNLRRNAATLPRRNACRSKAADALRRSTSRRTCRQRPKDAAKAGPAGPPISARNPKRIPPSSPRWKCLAKNRPTTSRPSSGSSTSAAPSSPNRSSPISRSSN